MSHPPLHTFAHENDSTLKNKTQPKRKNENCDQKQRASSLLATIQLPHAGIVALNEHDLHSLASENSGLIPHRQNAKTPFFKAFQSISKQKIARETLLPCSPNSPRHPTESEHIRPNPSNFFVESSPRRPSAFPTTIVLLTAVVAKEDKESEIITPRKTAEI